MSETLSDKELSFDYKTKCILSKDVKEHTNDFLKELKEKLKTPNTNSKNYIEINDFRYWINELKIKHFGKLLE